MPISMRCEHCSVKMKAPDEARGERVKCPQCQGITRAPSSPSEPPTVAPERIGAKREAPRREPVVAPEDDLGRDVIREGPGASKPKPKSDLWDEDDDLDDGKTPKREKGARRDESNDRKSADGRPKKSPVKKKKRSLLLTLGVLSGVLLLGCLSCGGLGYYAYTEIVGETNENVTAANVDKLKQGMTQKEIEAILGPGKKLDSAEFTSITTKVSVSTDQSINEERTKYWAPWVEKGVVYRWRNAKSFVLVTFSQAPESGGKLKGLWVQVPIPALGNMLLQDEIVQLPRNPAADEDATKLGLSMPKGGDSGSSKPALKANDLVNSPDKYKDKKVTFTGIVYDMYPTDTGGTLVLKVDGTVTLSCKFSVGEFVKIIPLAKRDSVEVTGVFVGKLRGLDTLGLNDCTPGRIESQAIAESAASLVSQFTENGEAAKAKYADKILRVTGYVSEVKIGKNRSSLDAIILKGSNDASGTPQTVIISCGFEKGWKDEFAKRRPNDRIVLTGRVDNFLPDHGKIIMNDCWLVE